MRRRFRMLSLEEDLDLLEMHLEDWGYYREIESFEWGASYWFRWGDDVIWWLNPASEPPEPRMLAFHICVKPESRGAWLSRRFIIGVEVTAENLDAERICAILSPSDRVNRGYLERLGWFEGENGWMIRDLGEA